MPVNVTLPNIAKTNELILQFFESRVQVGTATLVSSMSVVVTFPVAFAGVPVVVALPWSNPNRYYWATNITATGFTLNVNATAPNLTFGWIAIYR